MEPQVGMIVRYNDYDEFGYNSYEILSIEGNEMRIIWEDGYLDLTSADISEDVRAGITIEYSPTLILQTLKKYVSGV